MICFTCYAQVGEEIEQALPKLETKRHPLTFWQVKAYRP